MSNQSLDILLSLPRELVFCILSEWVGLKELSGLDVACCNHDKRDTLMAIFSSKEFVLGEKVPIGETNYISWVTKRSIRQSEFYVNGNMLEYLEYVKVFGTHVKRVTFVEPHQENNGTDTMIAALSYCECLVSLHMFGVGTSETPFEAIWRCSSLQELRIEFFHDLKIPVYHLTVDCVPPLQLTTLIINSCSVYAAELLEMTSPATLQSLQVSISEYLLADDLCAQLSKGYDLKALCLGNSPSCENLIDVLPSCPGLRHLDLDGSDRFDDTDEELTPDQPAQLAVLLVDMPLEVLRLDECFYDKELLTELAVHGCNTLRVLFLDNCSIEGDAVNNIASVCKQLTELRVVYIGSDVFATIELQLLNNLTHLMVGLCSDLRFKTVLDRVAIYCTNLTYLAVSMDESDPCDLSSLHDSNVLPALSVFNVCPTGRRDTSVLQTHRPNLRIGQADELNWHSFEDIVCNEGYKVW